MTFNNFNLHPKILKAVSDAGYVEPTTIQSKAIPQIMQGLDIRASAQTGTGKTVAFLLPALNRLMTPSSKTGKGPRILILAPTRELAMQIATQTEKYSKYLNQAKTVCVVGGVPYPSQIKNLSRPYDILIATPGRLIDFINRKKIHFSRLEMLVLDEADRMLDMGFIEPVEQIVAATPPSRQMLMFSATLQGSVLKLSDRLLKNPVDVIAHAEKTENKNIKQKLYYVDDVKHKNRLLDHILGEKDINSAIIFTSTKRYADQLVESLAEESQAAALHGDMNQRQRTRTLMKLKTGKIKILVATDVAARGIDVQSITHVINFDLPQNSEDYVHRIGRTGRAGAKGTALSFATRKESFLVKKIEKYTGQQIEVSEISGLEPKSSKESFSSKKGRRSPFPQNRKFKPRPGQNRQNSSRKSSTQNRFRSAK